MGAPGILNKVNGGVFATTDAPSGWFRDQTLFQNDPAKSTVFTISSVGEGAKKMIRESKEDRINNVLNGLKPFISDIEISGLESSFFSWDEVTWIRGGYASYPPGKFGLQKILARPEENLFFAGEHTIDKFATMNGALESGIRAAEEVYNSLTRE